MAARAPIPFPASRPGAEELILQAALREFAEEGYAGARTEHIARAARVNVALVFYYFKSKDLLYGAVLERIFSDWVKIVEKPLTRSAPPSEKLLDFVSTYFDFVAAAPERPRLVQQEMMRRGRVGSPHIRRLVQKYIKAVHMRVRRLVREGIAAGQFHDVDPENTVYSITGLITFYFASAPVVELLGGRNPVSRARIERRKAEVLKLIRNGLLKKPQRARAGVRKKGKRSA
jgi:TetR/AcrR family transcriptional regulator